MIEIKDKAMCMGCTACESLCPMHCITMEYDEEGYKYPHVNNSVCIDCGLCEKVCPCKKELIFDDFVTRAFAVQNKDKKIREESASGGAFTTLAENFIKQGGIVYGGAFDDDFSVCHIRVETTEELTKLRGSKYVQSDMKDNFRLVKQDLKEGRKVLFSGTPCQVAGLVSFLRGLYPTNNLLLVDLVCRGIPSPLLWSKFISNLSQKYGKLEYVAFRNKHFGYAGSTMAMRFADGEMRYTDRDIQFYKKLFFDDINTRPSCFKCHFKTVKRVSDFTIFDCWHVNEIDKSLDDDEGTTWVLVQSAKGLDYFEQVRKQVNVVEAPVEKAIQLDGMLATHCTTPNPRRDEFFKDIQIHGFDELLEKYFPMTIKKRIVNIVKPIFGKIGLIKILKRL